MTADAGDVGAGARAANAEADRCLDERRFVDAIPHARQAAALAPAWPDPWSNLVIGYKHARQWRECLDACDRRLELDGTDAAGIHWNAGIAATALGEWPLARRCWAAVGLEVPAGDGPLEMKLGRTPVRVGDEAPEVAWCDRIDPCRARVASVPRPEARRRCGDLVLHDGEPRGERRLGERVVPIFDELALLTPSTLGTWEVVIAAADEAARDRVAAELRAWERSTVVDDWTDGDAASAWARERRVGVAARAESALQPLRRFWGGWRREVISVRRVL